MLPYVPGEKSPLIESLPNNLFESQLHPYEKATFDLPEAGDWTRPGQYGNHKSHVGTEHFGMQLV